MKNHSLIRFFGLDKIYVRKYGVTFLLDPLLAIGATVFALQFLGAVMAIEVKYLAWFASSLLGIYFLSQLLKTMYARHIINSRAYAFENHLKNTRIYASAINTELNNLDDSNLIALDEKSGMYDITFNFYRKTKHGEYLSRQAFYTVYEVKLQRVLPHLVFDSRQAKNRQFKSLFLKAQKLSFDVNFDDYFDAYAPKTYAIDALSFISPEVLQAMLGLKQYDVEIIDDSLLVFAPLKENSQLPDFEQECLDLYHALNDNLDTYIDEHLYGDQRRKNVTAFSKRLLENPNRFILPMILSGAASVPAVYIMFKYAQDLRLLIPVFLFFTYVGKMVKIIKTNRQLEEEFKAHMDMHRVIKQTESNQEAMQK